MKTMMTAALLALVMATPAAAEVRIDLFPNYGPPSAVENGVYEPGFDPTPSLFAYGQNAVGAMLDGELSRGGSQAVTPNAFNTQPNNKIPYDYFRRTEFPTWGPTINPGGAFAAEKGTAWRVGIRIESSTAFTAAGLHYMSDDPFGSESTTLADRLVHQYAEGGFAPWLAVGIYYGADGIRGTADDVVCDSLACDPYTQPLNLLAWRGPGFDENFLTADLIALYGGDWEALRADDRLYFSGGYGDFIAPFRINQTWTLTGLDGQLLDTRSYTGIITGVPEPTSWAMLVAGFGLAGAVLRRRGALVA